MTVPAAQSRRVLPRRFVASAITVAALMLMSACAPTASTEPVSRAATGTVTETTRVLEPVPEPEAEPAPVFVERERVADPWIALEPATVVRVVDGDTAVFLLEDGTQEKVRFIGIDTPESTNKVEPYGKQASKYTAAALPVGSQVFLEEDVERRDRYGRLLAYVWLSRPADDSEAEIREKMLNAKIAADGFAQQLTIPPNVKYASEFGTFVSDARTANRGLWADPSSVAPAQRAPAATAKPRSDAGGTAGYIGNRNTFKFHYPDCSSVGQMNPSNKVPLSSRKQAVSQGYVPCLRCNP